MNFMFSCDNVEESKKNVFITQVEALILKHFGSTESAGVIPFGERKVFITVDQKAIAQDILNETNRIAKVQNEILDAFCQDGVNIDKGLRLKDLDDMMPRDFITELTNWQAVCSSENAAIKLIEVS